MRKVRLQKGLTMVELMIVLAVGAAIAAGVLALYFLQIRPSAYIDDKVRDFDQLVIALEQIKSNYGNAYPAGNITDLGALSSNPTSNAERLLVARIGAGNSNYKRWSYTCNSSSGQQGQGGDLQITVYVGDTNDQNLRYSVWSNISQNYRGSWACGQGYTGADQTFTCTLQGSVCRQ